MVCSNCYDPNGMETRDLPPLGTLAQNSLHETLHKLLMGHPGAKMPAISVLRRDLIADLLAFLQMLPEYTG